uniref:Uncharacterized protein n=1 Tax=Lepeophtheirus salmonis TaxID=72036 RepID=A0A0K2UGE9_LEPSM
MTSLNILLQSGNKMSGNEFYRE